jgi:hypothetical protein
MMSDSIWINDFGRPSNMLTLALWTHRHSLSHKVQLATLRVWCLAFARPEVFGVLGAADAVLNHLWWGLRRDLPDEFALLTLDMLTALLRVDRERAVSALRFAKKACRTTAILERPAELCGSASASVALTAMTFLLEFERTAPSDSARAGIRRELLLLDAVAAARQQATRGHLLNGASVAILKALRSGGAGTKAGASSKIVVTVVDNEQEMVVQMDRKATLGDVMRKVLRGKEQDHGLLVLGSVLQSGVWANADLALAPLDAMGMLRCDIALLPYLYCIEGPTFTEPECNVDPRMDVQRALEYFAVVHFEDGLVPSGMQLKIKDGMWLEPKARLMAQTSSGMTLQIRAVPTEVLP